MILNIKTMLLAGAAAIIAVGISYEIGHYRGDAVGAAREKAAANAATLKATAEHNEALARRESEKKALQAKIDADEFSRGVASRKQLMELYPPAQDTSAPVYLPPAMRKVLEGLAK